MGEPTVVWVGLLVLIDSTRDITQQVDLVALIVIRKCQLRKVYELVVVDLYSVLYEREFLDK